MLSSADTESPSVPDTWSTVYERLSNSDPNIRRATMEARAAIHHILNVGGTIVRRPGSYDFHTTLLVHDTSSYMEMIGSNSEQGKQQKAISLVQLGYVDLMTRSVSTFTGMEVWQIIPGLVEQIVIDTSEQPTTLEDLTAIIAQQAHRIIVNGQDISQIVAPGADVIPGLFHQIVADHLNKYGIPNGTQRGVLHKQISYAIFYEIGLQNGQAPLV